jgi:dTDP-4-dehydrorhamnose reductase
VKVLVTGADGQVGRMLRATCPADVELIACGHGDLDIVQTAACSGRAGC